MSASVNEQQKYEQLRRVAGSIPVGATEHREPCPFCNGGINGDRGFSITRTSEAEAKYCCHRASCGKAGRIAAWGFRLPQVVDNSSKELEKQFTPRLYTGESVELDTEWMSSLLARYELDGSDYAWASWFMDRESGRLGVPVCGPLGLVRGYELRIRPNKHTRAGPKTSHYRHLEETWLAWYRRAKVGAVVVVEDVISALKVSRHFQAVSLMGSHVSLDHVIEISQVAGGSPVFLCLDKDATAKAMEFILKYRFIAPNFRSVPLSKDLKFYNNKEIGDLFNAYY